MEIAIKILQASLKDLQERQKTYPKTIKIAHRNVKKAFEDGDKIKEDFDSYMADKFVEWQKDNAASIKSVKKAINMLSAYEICNKKRK